MRNEKFEKYTPYNIAAISFAPAEIAHEIKNFIPEFEMSYKPDNRQKIAESWPQTIDDSQARKDWNWKHRYDLKDLVKTMLEGLHFTY